MHFSITFDSENRLSQSIALLKKRKRHMSTHTHARCERFTMEKTSSVWADYVLWNLYRRFRLVAFVIFNIIGASF